MTTIASYTPFEIAAGEVCMFTGVSTMCRVCSKDGFIEQIIGRATDDFLFVDGELKRKFDVLYTTEFPCQHAAERRELWVRDLKYKGREQLFQSLLLDTVERLSSQNS